MQNQAAEQTVLSEEEILEEQEKMRRMQDVPYTREKMQNYIRKYKSNGMVRAADLPLDTKEDALADVAAAAFAPANQMDVHVDDHYIKTDQVHLRDFTLTDSVVPVSTENAEVTPSTGASAAKETAGSVNSSGIAETAGTIEDTEGVENTGTKEARHSSEITEATDTADARHKKDALEPGEAQDAGSVKTKAEETDGRQSDV